MKIQKAMMKKTFTGKLNSVFEYETKSKVPILLLNCTDDNGIKYTFSNFKEQFDSLSCGLEAVEPGTPVQVTYTTWTSPTGRTYNNFKTVSFAPHQPLSAAELDDYVESFDEDEEMPF